MKFAIAHKNGEQEEYMSENFGDDCFTDDIGNAILFHNWRNIPFNVMEATDFVVKVEEDEDGCLLVVGILSKEEMDADNL